MTPADALSAARPFAGLRPYGYADHEFFFGREDQSYALYRLIDSSGFVAVIGSSGSGKSSLVLAGLLPLLKAERDEGGRNWRWEIMRPGDRPLDNLTELLARLSDDRDPDVRAERTKRIAYHVRRSSFGIADALREIDGFQDKKLFLVVDQFEELFRFAYANRVALSPGEERARDAAAQFVQILLEADRDPGVDVHVLITMRSDFIGDCARFHGLPEAVSACQFLAPALTRDQLEEAIAKPIEQAGATIAPELVQRLLNDSGDEMDQLPVLQHCLLRLWRQAGDRQAAACRAAAREDEHRAPVRYIVEEDYSAVGKLSGALSQHANQILDALPERRVELVFRALSEADKERRVIRRSLLFGQLQAETGIGAEDLRAVLEPFRAADCSFLRPPPSTQPVLQSDTRIDIGHEALLRRWERVSGDPNGAERQRLGWWRVEENDGQKYRFLLFMVETGAATLPFSIVEANIAWWNEYARTNAWAERYGGRYDDVARLLADSARALRADEDRRRAEEESARRARRWRLALFVTIPVIIVVGGAGVFSWIKKNAADTSARIARINSAVAGKAADQLNSQVYEILILRDAGALTGVGAKKLLENEEQFVSGLTDDESIPSIIALRSQLSLAFSDVHVYFQEQTKALKYANDAENLADRLVQLEPSNAKWLALDYAAASRVGTLVQDDIAASLPNDSLKEYHKAQLLADAALAINPGSPGLLLNQGVAHRQIGDALSGFDAAGARQEYEKSLAIIAALVGRENPRPQWRGELASAQQRLGRFLLDRDDLEGADRLLRSAFAIRGKLVQEYPKNETFNSNLATSHSDIADLNEKKGDWEGAIAEYNKAIDQQSNIVSNDPDHLSMKRHLVAIYERAEKLLERHIKNLRVGDADWLRVRERQAQFYSYEGAICQTLVTHEPINPVYRIRLRAIADELTRNAESLADYYSKQGQWNEAVEAYRLAVDAWDKVRTAQPECDDCAARTAEIGAKIGDVLAARP